MYKLLFTYCFLLFVSVVSKSRLSKGSSSSGSSNHTNDCEDIVTSNGETQSPVLVIPLIFQNNEHIGLLTESKVLSMGPIETITNGLENLHLSGSVENLLPEPEEPDRPDTDGGAMSSSMSQEKRTRFSHTHDEGSIGNTSDNLEAISEAASNHSVASSLELENEDQNDNDNLSDMVSANVSGRGTPNISGRDTPSSQVTEGEERQMEARPERYLPAPQSLISKQIRSEIDDKFCKFEIKKLLEGDETISIISDTWSTDVLASDSEMIEAHDRNRTEPPLIEQPLVEPVVQQLLDVSETASESAWSTDVLASDSERLTEVDTDDTGSVARSDDTGRSEVDETPPVAPVLLPEASPVTSRNNSVINPLAYGLRPLRDEVPNSPTRSEFHVSLNVTGRGGRKSDYRRRTVEYVDSNANNVHNSVMYGESIMKNTEKVNHDTIDRSILRTSSNIHSIENVQSRREAMLIDVTPNGLHIVDHQRSRETTVITQSSSEISGGIGVAAVSPAYLLANHVGANKFITKHNKNDIDPIRSSNASLSSMSSGSSSSSSSSGSRNKTCNGGTDNIGAGGESGIPESSHWNGDKRWVHIGDGEIGATGIRDESENSLNITSTPSGSTSELSVLSPTNTQLSPVGVPGRNPSSIKPSTSTGAIPKSISFDMTAEKGDKDEDDKKNKSFFGKLRMGFRNRRGKSPRGIDDIGRYETGDGDTLRSRRFSGPDAQTQSARSSGGSTGETSEDILAKYRRKPSTASDSNTTDSGNSSVKSKGTEADDERINIDPSNIEGSFAFIDAKKKLRLVLSNSDAMLTPLETARIRNENIHGRTINELVTFLQLQLARARNLKDWNNVARISETLRCVKLFDETGCRKLCQALKDDYCKRALYNQYLLRCRQVLLCTLSYIEGLQLQVCSERELSSNCLVAGCVRLFLERYEQYVLSFCEEFGQLKVSDEKTDLLNTFLESLANEMHTNPLWQGKKIYLNF